MGKWRLTTWLIIWWTLGIGALFAVMVGGADIRIIEAIVVAVLLGQVWLAGLAPLVVAWLVGRWRRSRDATHTG